MYSLKEAMLIKDQNPDAEVSIFYMDMRTFGKGYHRYYQYAKEDLGIEFTRCRVPVVKQNPKTNDLMVLARTEDGRFVRGEFDIVTLAIGQCASPRIAELGHTLDIETNQWGFLKGDDYWQVGTSREGIYVCGSAMAPADISETVTQASAAAGQASILLSSSRSEAADDIVSAEEISVDDAAGVAIFVCRCGEEIASVIDLEQIIAFTKTLPGVVRAEDISFLCLPESLDRAKQSMAESGASMAIFAACTPYYYERLFEEAIQEAGMDASLWQLVNFREQVSWVHKNSKTEATQKASPGALVIGSGVSGLTAALCLARQGIEVHVADKSDQIGDDAGNWRFSLSNKEPQDYIDRIYREVVDNPLVYLHLGSELLETNGQAGSFVTTLTTGQETPILIEHGAVIIATRMVDYQPDEYSYGQDDRIITQKVLRRRLQENTLGKQSTVVMIQCVGFRNKERPYCSRTCCMDALLNALEIKKQDSATQVYILYRDIMTYGFNEHYYALAREAGVVFVRYESGKEPEVVVKEQDIEVCLDETILSGRLHLKPDLLVLSTGIIPGENKPLAETFSLELTEDGFFKEIDTKFCPVDSSIDGVFICGPAHSPGSLGEQVIQAQAAAQRAAIVLNRRQLESGRITAEVNERTCSGCGLCVIVCPYSARKMEQEQRISVVVESLCRGCGHCVVSCPNGASRLRGMKDRQVFSMIDTAL
jgi:heterodisulfide reductase subunit A